MKITDRRVNCKNNFRHLAIGEVFEYLESFYIAEVDMIDAELIVKQKGADNE